MGTVVKNLGHATAYAAARAGGYTGTRAEFEAIMAAYPTVEGRVSAIEKALVDRVTTLDGTPLGRWSVVEAVGVPAYLDTTDLQDAAVAAYGLTAAGWYVFSRIDAPDGVTVTAETTVSGAAGAIITAGADHVDVAVRFDVAAESCTVTVTWADGIAENVVFKATDLAIRNLDYRTTFYVYDAAPYVRYEYALTTDTTIQSGKKYYTKDENDVYTLSDVSPFTYQLTADATFAAGKTYYTTDDGSTYTAATVTEGEAVPADTYYEQIATPVPAETYYNHSKIIIQGLVRNITYRLDEIIDCPMEFILPEIEDETHGCWYEIRCRHAGEYSMTLTPPSADVKIATEHTQKETAGINMIDLHYTVIDGLKLWRFMNTHSSIPT